MKKPEIICRSHGKPNEYYLHDQIRWFASIKLNGELTEEQQMKLMDKVTKAVNEWRAETRLGRMVKIFRVKKHKSKEQIKRQLYLAAKRYFWNEREVWSMAGPGGNDFVDGFITYRLEGYEL